MSENIQDAFDKLGESTPEINTAAVSEEATAVDEEEKQLLAIYKKEVEANPEIEQVAGSMSDSLVVTKVLGYTNGGDRIYDEEATKAKGKRQLKEVGRIVGFIVKNVGKAPIPYTTYECVKKADGKGYDVKEVQATIPAGGKEVQIAKKHLIFIGCTPQFGLTFQNAGLKKAPNQKIIGATKEELGNKFYLSFKKIEGKSISVHSPKLKKQIGIENADKTWSIDPTYAKVFGFLENEVPVAEKAKADKKPKFSSKDAQANYIYNTLLAGAQK